MAELVLNYNPKNLQAQNLVNYILSTGFFTPKIDKNSNLERAFEDLKAGRVYHAITKKKDE